MAEIKEGASPTRSAETTPNVSALRWLTDKEENAGTKRFNFEFNGIKEPYAIRSASAKAIGLVGSLMRRDDLVDEMNRLGISVTLGELRVSVTRPGDNEEDIKFWHHVVGRPVPPVIKVNVGPEEFEHKGSFGSMIAGNRIWSILEGSKNKSEVMAVLERLGDLTPKEIVGAFREQIEAGQNTVLSQRKKS